MDIIMYWLEDSVHERESIEKSAGENIRHAFI